MRPTTASWRERERREERWRNLVALAWVAGVALLVFWGLPA